MIGGPEFTIGWEWVDERQLGWSCTSALLPLPDWAPRVSSTCPPAREVEDAQLVEGYRRGEGANDVMAVSSGTADARPQSSRHTIPGGGRPKK